MLLQANYQDCEKFRKFFPSMRKLHLKWKQDGGCLFTLNFSIEQAGRMTIEVDKFCNTSILGI
jgi:hypothetical protein